MSLPTELLSVEEMYLADRLAIDGGVAGSMLMETAGEGIAIQIQRKWPPGRALVLCGPGNNGGAYAGPVEWPDFVACTGRGG